MAGTIIDYLKEYGDVPFAELQMNDVDSLILCQLAYLKFDGIVSSVHENGPSISLKDVEKHADFDKLFADERYEEENRALFGAAVAGKRFCNMRLNCYINVIEKEWETQFSAITYLLDDGTLYIAFRGTDETIVGWKEDFNMAFLSPVPGQSYSVKYLNMVMSRLYKPFYIGGHSKGGNLAVYASAMCRENIQQRIVKVYSHDGPGFLEKTLQTSEFQKISDRIEKTLPQSSIIGMLLENQEGYHIVKSNRNGLLQHDQYSWEVEDHQFIYIEELTKDATYTDKTLSEWLNQISTEDRERFIDALFGVLNANQMSTINDFRADWQSAMTASIHAATQLDSDTKKFLLHTLKKLAAMGFKNMLPSNITK